MTRVVSKSLYALAHDFLSYGKGETAEWIIITYRSGEEPLLVRNLRVGDCVHFELEKNDGGEMPLYRLRDAWSHSKWDEDTESDIHIVSLRFLRWDRLADE